MRRGVTLLELVAVLTIMGVVAGLAIPAVSQVADRLAVEHQAARLLAVYRQAWLTARTQHRLVLLRITSDSLAIRTVTSAGSPDTALVWVTPGPSSAGVALSSAAHTAVFGPDGIGMGLSNARHVLQRGGIRREVVVSRLGRVRIGG